MVVAWTGIGEAVDDGADAGAVAVEVMFAAGTEREVSRRVVRQWPEEEGPPAHKSDAQLAPLCTEYRTRSAEALALPCTQLYI